MQNLSQEWKVRIISTAFGIGTIAAITILDMFTSVEITSLIMEKMGPTGGLIVVALITEIVKGIRNRYELGKLGAREEDDDVILI